MKNKPKILTRNDIPMFMRPARYRINVNFTQIENCLKSWDERTEDGKWMGLDLDPDFQRGHVWSEDKQIKFVEFILRGGQSSKVILFNHPNWEGSWDGQMVLVDGKQRLEAVRKFMNNRLPIFGGYYLKDCEDKILRLTDADLIFSVNNLKTRKEVLQWYLDLNDGGVVHTDDELNKVRDLLEKENEKT